MKRSDNLLFFFFTESLVVALSHWEKERGKEISKFLKTDAISSERITGRDLSPFETAPRTLEFFVSTELQKLGLHVYPRFLLYPLIHPPILQLDPVFYFYTARLLPREEIRRMNPKWDELEGRWNYKLLISDIIPRRLRDRLKLISTSRLYMSTSKRMNNWQLMIVVIAG